jgi:hypothetical protein
VVVAVNYPESKVPLAKITATGEQSAEPSMTDCIPLAVGSKKRSRAVGTAETIFARRKRLKSEDMLNSNNKNERVYKTKERTDEQMK